MTVFEALPNALETWQIAQVELDTIRGKQIASTTDIDVIIDEISSTELGETRDDIPPLNSDTLLYCQPSQMPTIDTASLLSDYTIIDPSGRAYAILNAGIGKNQQTGEIEHVELIVRRDGSVLNGN